jgi:hypothetical protein
VRRHDRSVLAQLSLANPACVATDKSLRDFSCMIDRGF